jgi:hypothetical protein
VLQNSKGSGVQWSTGCIRPARGPRKGTESLAAKLRGIKIAGQGIEIETGEPICFRGAHREARRLGEAVQLGSEPLLQCTDPPCYD